MSKILEPNVKALPGKESSYEKKPKRTQWSLLWDTFDKSPEERKFLFKLDGWLLTIACLGYFIKYLDQANLFNAFVSGLKEDLGMYGNELNYAITAWTAGYVLGEIPSNIIITRVRPSIWLPTLEIIWSVLTMLLSRCTQPSQLYALRFFIGLTEAGFYPGIIYVLGSWYRKDEIAKRTAIFAVSASIAGMFSGYLMAALTGLDGTHGLKGWQWLFIMDGVISLPIAFAGFFLYPDFPSNTRAFYINEDDKLIAKARTAGRPQKEPYTKAKIAKIFTSWHIYLLPLVFLLCGAAAAGTAQPIFALYLKSTKKYTVSQINTYPTATSGVSVVSTLVYAWVSDGLLKGRRWPILIFAATVNFVTFTSLAVWNIPEGWRWACYIISGQVNSISPISLSWGNDIVAQDEEERSIVIAAMADSAYIVGIWLVLLIWKQKDAPRYSKGFITASCFSVAAVVVILVVRTLARRELHRRRNSANDASEVPSPEDSDKDIPTKV